MRYTIVVAGFLVATLFSCNSKNKEYKYLALGDSYTIGESVMEAERWPHQLNEKLIENGYSLSREKIIARTGWTTDELMAGIDTSDLEPPYDLVTLLIGVNNQYRGRDTANFRKELLQLVNLAVMFAGDAKEKVIIVSIPDWGVTPFAEGRDREIIQEEIDAYNSIQEDLANELDITFLNITEISRNANSRPELLAEDGLHPSGKMYEEWVELLFPLAKRILDKH